MENIYRRRLSLVLSLVLVLNEMLSPLFIWADEGTDTESSPLVISGEVIVTEDTGSVILPPPIDSSLTGSSETSSGTYEGYAT